MAIETRTPCQACRASGIVARREVDRDLMTDFRDGDYGYLPPNFTITYDACDRCGGKGYVVTMGESAEVRVNRPQNTLTVRVPAMYLYSYDTTYDQTKVREAIQHYLPPSCFLSEIVRHEFDAWSEMHVFEVTVSVVVPTTVNARQKWAWEYPKLPPAPKPVPEEPKEQPKEVLGGTVRRILVMEEKKDDENGEEKK